MHLIKTNDLKQDMGLFSILKNMTLNNVPCLLINGLDLLKCHFISFIAYWQISLVNPINHC